MLKRLMRQLEETSATQRLNNLSISGDDNFISQVYNVKKNTWSPLENAN